MEMRRSDSSGTDDDLPPGPLARGNRVVGNGKAGTTPVYAPSHGTKNIDQLIRTLEQDAYTAVLRAFGAQSEHITWAKERLISDLRKELRVTDEQHREFLAKVAGDDSLRQIREWRESGEGPSLPASSNLTSTAQVHPPPPVPQSRKKQKTGAVSQAAMPPPPPPPTQPPATKPLVPSLSLPSTAPKKGAARGKSKGGAQDKTSNHGRGPSQGKRKDGSSEMQDPWVGQVIKTRWPDDNTFYEAYVRDYHKEDGTHTLVYDMGTENETCERVDLAKMAPDDIQMNGVIPDGKLQPCGASDWKSKKPGKNSSVPSAEKLQGSAKKRVVPQEKAASQKWSRDSRKGPNVRQLTLPSVDSLAKQVQELEHKADLSKIEHAKRIAKEHEETIRKVLVEVGESSDEGDSDAQGHGANSNHRNGYSRNPVITSDDENDLGSRHAYSDGDHHDNRDG